MVTTPPPPQGGGERLVPTSTLVCLNWGLGGVGRGGGRLGRHRKVPGPPEDGHGGGNESWWYKQVILGD